MSSEAYARALMELGWVARDQERYDEALVWFQRAEEALEGLVHDPQHLEVILSIDEVATNDRLAVRSSRPGRTAAEAAGVAHPHARAVERACRGRSRDRTPCRAGPSGPGPR